MDDKDIEQKIDDVADKEVENDDDMELDEAELKRVEEMLKSSKSKRKKMLENNSSASTNKTFIEVCKENIFIPIILVVAIALIGFGVYYFWPKSEEKDINSIGITYEQLVANYHSSVAYTGLFKDFNTELPEMTYVENDSTNDKLNYFGAPITNGFTTYGLAIQGSERKSDKELCGLRVMFEVPATPEEQEENIKIVFLFYDMIMNSVFPELSSEEIDTMLASTSKSQEFEVYKDVAYRFTIQKVDNVSFYALDFAPAADYQNIK